jgi:hypothetical protein
MRAHHMRLGVLPITNRPRAMAHGAFEAVRPDGDDIARRVLSPDLTRVILTCSAKAGVCVESLLLPGIARLLVTHPPTNTIRRFASITALLLAPQSMPARVGAVVALLRDLKCFLRARRA